MGINADILGPDGWQAALAALEWQVDLGVAEISGEAPVDRYTLPETTKTVPVVAKVELAVVVAPQADPVQAARTAAQNAGTLAELRAALTTFDLCEVRRGAKNTVFGTGNPNARVLIVGEAPDRDEDIEGQPFVGRTGALLDRMFAAIGLSRASQDPATALYLTHVLPWRPPQDRDPAPEEIATMRPFIERQIELVDPALIVVMGNAPCQSLLGTGGILRLRGSWATALGRPVLPMIHPAKLLRNPEAKREAWADLLALKARLG